MNATTTAPKIDLALKLLAYALDPAASEGEAENAAIKFIRAMRREGISIEDLAREIVPEAQPPIEDDDDEPGECEIIMGFGRHVGKSLGEIARKHPDYVRWAAANLNQEWLRDAFESVRIWMEERNQ